MTRQLIEYESKVNSVLQKIEVSALCQYNKKHFTPDIIKNVIETHPTVIYKNHVCKNYHYIPTEEFLSERDKYDEATRMLNQILLIENYVESLESREKELIAAKTRAEEATRLKSEFLAQMSHEIRSPINTMLNYISLIKEMAQEIENPDLDYSFEAIDSSSRRLIRTIDLILNVSQLQTGRYECNFREIDLELDVIIPLVREMQSSAKAKGLKLKYEGEAEESKVIADEYTVTQIFQNLIDNAIKYTKEGEVRVTTRVNEKVVEVIISDTGIGMSEEFMDKLFDPFTQEEQGYTRHYEGSGLGLALVSGYCRLNNASIKVESEKGKGTNFTVCFSKDRKYTYF